MSTKTPTQLPPATTVLDTDLYTGYPDDNPVIGPMYAISALDLRLYMQANCLLYDGSVAMTGALQAFAGTEGSPGVTFSGDADTGLYHVSANKFGLVAGGVSYLNISSAAIEAKTLVSITLGADLTPATTPSTTSVGYLGLPQNTKSADYTLVMADAGKEIPMSGNHTVTIPANASVAFPLGTIGAASVETGDTLTLAITSDTLEWLPSGGTGSRTVTGPGMVFYRKRTSTRWWCWGFNVT